MRSNQWYSSFRTMRTIIVYNMLFAGIEKANAKMTRTCFELFNFCTGIRNVLDLN